MDTFKELMTHFLGTSFFWEWLIITLILVTLALLGRRKFQVQLQTGTPPGVSTLLILAGLLVILNLRAVPTGDEPHYLIMTQSLLRDGDFDMRNNYEQMDYLAYYPDIIPDPHVTTVGNHWYPVHGLGLPLLAAPFFAAAGRPGVVVMLALLTVAGLRILWSFLRRVGMGSRATGFATIIAAFTLPLASLSGQVFPEIPAFLIIALALRAIVAPALAGRDFAALLFSLVFLPWLHPKYAAVALALLLAAALAHRQKRVIRALAIACSLFIASVAGLALLTYQWYGVPLPGVSIMMAKAPFREDWLIPLAAHFLVEPWVGLTGVLFDQQSGLFIASPVYVLAIPGLLLLWRRKRSLAIICVLVFASLYLPAGAFGVWNGGFSSPARLLTPTVPVLALGIANLLDTGDQRDWKFFSILALPSLLHAYLMMTLPSFTRYGDPLSEQNYFISLFERFIHLDLTILFPVFHNIGPATWLTVSVYLLAIILTTIFLVQPKSQEYA